MQRIVCILAVLVTVITYTSAAGAQPARTTLIAATDAARLSTWDCQERLGQEKTVTSFSYRTSQSRPYRAWVLRLWKGRSAACWEKHRAVMSTPEGAICAVFGDRCKEALRVVHCESRFSTTAQNGQYLGLFQMGSRERATYGHGETAYAQAIAAYRYFVASGRDWSPWSCKPWY